MNFFDTGPAALAPGSPIQWSTTPNVLNLGLPFNKCYVRTCTNMSTLSRCSRCHMVWYCSRRHQEDDWRTHKVNCNIIRATAARRARERAALEARDRNPFEHDKGRFYFVPGTRAYLSEAVALVMALLNIRNGEAVDVALSECKQLLENCDRGDSQGVRWMMPAIMMRRGHDQAAYEFIKWWATTTDDYDWADMSLPYLDLDHSTNTLEPSDALMEPWRRDPNLSFAVAIALIKMRLLADLRKLQEEVDAGRAPANRMLLVKEHAVSDVLLARKDVVDKPDYRAEIAEMADQVKRCYLWIKTENKYFWPAVLDPTEFSTAQLGLYTRGDKNEAILAFRYNWYVFTECEQTLAIVRALAAHAGV